MTGKITDTNDSGFGVDHIPNFATKKYDAKFSEPTDGEDVVDAYDKLRQREYVSDEVLKFGGAAREFWFGADKAHFKLLRYSGFLKGSLYTSVTAYAAFFLACFAADYVARNGGQLGGILAVLVQTATALSFLIYFVVRDRHLRDHLDKMRERLAQHYDANVEQLYNKNLSEALQLLPTVGVNEREAIRASELLIDIFTYWRILERIPTYIANIWLFDRIQAREARDDRLRAGMLALIPLNVIFISIAVGAYLLPELPSFLDRIRPFISSAVRNYYPSVAAAAALFATVGYYFAHRKWRNDILLHANAGLSVSDEGDEFLKKQRVRWEQKWGQDLMPVNWQTRIAQMDPAPVITKNYRDLFHAYMKASAS